MNQARRFYTGILEGAALTYLMTAFIEWNWNPYEWSTVARFIDVVSIVLVMLGMGSVLVKEDQKDKK
jgi:hypothetical protein